jgi:hypothetical protein
MRSAFVNNNNIINITNTEPKKVTPEMERPIRGLRVKTCLRAGSRGTLSYEDGGIVHTDNWREGQ